jgi:hypothetical protein
MFVVAKSCDSLMSTPPIRPREAVVRCFPPLHHLLAHFLVELADGTWEAVEYLGTRALIVDRTSSEQFGSLCIMPQQEMTK